MLFYGCSCRWLRPRVDITIEHLGEEAVVP